MGKSKSNRRKRARRFDQSRHAPASASAKPMSKDHPDSGKLDDRARALAIAEVTTVHGHRATDHMTMQPDDQADPAKVRIAVVTGPNSEVSLSKETIAGDVWPIRSISSLVIASAATASVAAVCRRMNLGRPDNGRQPSQRSLAMHAQRQAEPHHAAGLAILHAPATRQGLYQRQAPTADPLQVLGMPPGVSRAAGVDDLDVDLVLVECIADLHAAILITRGRMQDRVGDNLADQQQRGFLRGGPGNQGRRNEPAGGVDVFGSTRKPPYASLHPRPLGPVVRAPGDRYPARGRP